MAHLVETMAWANKVPWHGLGVEVDANISTDDMLVQAGLDWTVSMRPLYYPKTLGGTDLRKAHKRMALVRDTDLEMFDIAGERWKPTQNHAVLDFFREFVKAGDMTLETAGSLKGGRFIWALARLADDFKLSETDTFRNYLLLMSPHQVGYALIAQFTSVRVVCANTMGMALGSDFKGSTNRGSNGGAFRMSHVRAFDNDVQQEAKTTLGLAYNKLHEFNSDALLLSQAKAHPDQVQQFWYEVIQEDQPVAELTDGETAEPAPRVVKKFEAALLEGPGATLPTALGTWFGAANAVSYVVDHELGRSRDTAMTSAWFGQGANLKTRAWEVAKRYANAA
jgi:phage/plasmid-like protein (TIGR03299 family)